MVQVDGEAAAAASGQQQQELDPALAMASLDIFAGCGGLSEGMHQVGWCWAAWVDADHATCCESHNRKWVVKIPTLCLSLVSVCEWQVTIPT